MTDCPVHKDMRFVISDDEGCDNDEEDDDKEDDDEEDDEDDVDCTCVSEEVYQSYCDFLAHTSGLVHYKEDNKVLEGETIKVFGKVLQN